MRSVKLTPVITLAVAIAVAIVLLVGTTARTGPTGEAQAATPANHEQVADPELVLGSAAQGEGKRVALTFDDGPDPVWTPKVLDLLAARHAHATFCLIGENARAHPDLVRRIVAEGHTLCDHTATHDQTLRDQSLEKMTTEIVGGKASITAAAPGAAVPYFRAPEGNFSKRGAQPSLQRVAAAADMRSLGWAVDSLDWTKPGVTKIVDSVRTKLGEHDVVLMHDGGGDRAQTVAALKILLGWLDQRGYAYVLPA